MELVKSFYSQTMFINSKADKIVAELTIISEKLDTFINLIKETNNDSTVLQNSQSGKNIGKGA